MRSRLAIGLVLALGFGVLALLKLFPKPQFEDLDHSIEATWIVFRTRSTAPCRAEVDVWPVSSPARKETHPMTTVPELSHAEIIHTVEPDTEYAFQIRLITDFWETKSAVGRVRTKPKVQILDVQVQPEATRAVVTFRTVPATICIAWCRILPDYENNIWASDIERVAAHRLVLAPLAPDTAYVLAIRSKHGVRDFEEDETLGMPFRTKPAR